MADKNIVCNSGSLGIAGWLGLLFITLKLCGVISWPWLWVLAPFWIGVALILAAVVLIPAIVLAAVGVFALIGWVIGAIARFGSRNDRD